MTISVGLLGAGWFGREAHLANLLRMDDVEVVAASSRSESSLEQVQAAVGTPILTTDNWREIAETPNVDAVIVALTNDQHHAASIAAFEHGKHVLCEKPLGMSVGQCTEIIEASAAAGKVLQVGHEMRFQRLYQQMEQMIEDGAVGTPRMMWCREFRGSMRPGWRSTQKLTGGTVLEKNSHHFDLFNWMLATDPVRVSAVGGRDVLLDREVLDNIMVIVEHEGGRRSSLELCLFAPHGGDCEIGLVGEGGRIDSWNQSQKLVHHRFDLPDRTEMRIADFPDEAGFVDGSGRIDRGIRPELEHFVRCCQTGDRPLTDGESARMSVAVCLAAQISVDRQETVTISELFES